MEHRTLAAAVVLGLGLTFVGCGPSGEPDRASLVAGAPTSASQGLQARPAEPAAELNDRSGLPDYLAYAALNNPGLEAAFNRWKAAMERVPQAKALPDPRFSYRYYIVEVETRVGPQRQAFTLAQMFPWFGKLDLKSQAAAEAAAAERQRYEAAKFDLFYRVQDAYYEYYYLGRAIDSLRENLQLLTNLEQVVRVRYETSGARAAGLDRLQVELGKLADRVRSMEDMRAPVQARLNATLNRPVGAKLPWPQSVQDRPVSITDEQLLEWLAESSPQLRALDHEIARGGKQVELARKQYFPDITLSVDYIDTANSPAAMRPPDSGNDPVIAMVSINLPIWFQKLAAGVREARFNRSAMEFMKVETANKLATSVKMASYGFRDAERKISLYRDTLIPRAEQSLNTNLAAFRAGSAAFADLIDSQRILLAFSLEYQRALANRAQRLAELEMLVGREIPSAGNPTTAPDDSNDAGIMPEP